MRTLTADLRFAFRMMRKAPFVTAVALLSLALGIGANATVYAWLRGAVLRPLGGVADQGRIVVLSTVTQNRQLIEVSYPDYRDFLEGQHQAELAASRTEPVSWRGEGPPQRIWAEAASGNFFQVAGVQPALGRLLQPSDDKQGQPVVAVLGNAFWRDRLAGDPGIVGKSLRLNGLDALVIGVAAEGFQAAPEGGISMDVFVPLKPFQLAMGRGVENRDTRNLKIMGRLAPGAGVPQAQSAMEALAKDLALKYPDEDRGLGVKVAPLSEAPWGSQGVLAPALRLLLVAVALILLLACANVASLLLTRAVGRQQEFSIRAALGAGRGRLARQMLTESVLLGLLGGALGLVASIWATGLLQHLMPPTDKPISLHAGLDGSVLAFSLFVSLAAGLLLGCLPILTSRLTPSAEALKEGGARATSSPRARRWLGALVVGEMALATMLLAGAGLTIRSLNHASDVKLGFDPSHVLLAGIELNAAAYPHAKVAAFTHQVLDRLKATPGVEDAAFGTFAPLGLEGGSWEDLSFEGYTPGPDESLKLYGNALSPGYFSTLRIPILEGRDFNDQDRRDTQLVIILSEAAAHRYFPNGALGHRVKQGEDWRTVVGVAADIKVHHLAETPQSFAYYPLTQWYTTGLTLHVRTAGNPSAILPAVRQTVADADPDLPIVALPMTDYLQASTLLLRMAASLLAMLGALALLLACLGIFAVMSFSVAQRRQEMGVRMALGAAPRQLLALVLSEGMLLAGLGAFLGILAMALVAPAMSPLLLQVNPRDPATLLGVPLVLLTVAFAACALPAFRASRTDPAAALHSA